MHPKVEEFLQKARAEELKKRRKKLIELGLSEAIEVDSQNGYDSYEWVWNNEKGISEPKYYRNDIDISDEEYEEILKYYPNTNSTPISDSAESILEVLNVITLIFGIAAGFICFIIGVIGQYGSSYLIISGICIAIISTISWAALKVILNISNNLHQINSKLK